MKREFVMTINTKTVPNKVRVGNLSRLSLQTGYSLSHLSRVFAKKTVPSIACLSILAKVLGTNIVVLLDLINERKVYVKGKTGTI